MISLDLVNGQKKLYERVKRETYINICECANNKVKLDSLYMIEKVERIGLRGAELVISPQGKFDVIVGHKTNNTIIEEVLVPMVKRYGMPQKLINDLEKNIQPKYIVGFRNNISDITRHLYANGKEHLIKNDTYGYLKAKSFGNDVKYILSAIGEKKCIAYENKIKRLEKRKSKLIT